jgi:hypothetical protein
LLAHHQPLHQVITEQSTVIAPESPFYILKDLQARYFFARLSPVQRIDTSLVALTVMSYLLSRRNDLIALLENMLKINFAFFSDHSQDPLITSSSNLQQLESMVLWAWKARDR